jgi:hypothetical protein
VHNLIVISVLGVIVAVAALWLRNEVRIAINRLIAGGCPMQTNIETQLKDIDGKLEAVSNKAGLALEQSGTATNAVNSIRRAEEHEAKVMAAPAHEQRYRGRRL